jgi:D-alanine--poly(phosphoribitol) ligase subunit 1
MKYNFTTKQFIETEVSSNKLAIVGSDTEIDWLTLKSKIEELVGIFKKNEVPTGHPVIIYGHKEYLFPLAILACIHSNTTYIPIDKIYPIERIKKIIKKTGSQILINCSDVCLDLDIAVNVNSKLETTINYTPDFTDKIYGNTEDPLQYIMFTSGSTGEPKGVQITQNSILTFLDWAKKDFGLSGEDVFMNQAPFTFDVSLCDILNSFVHGGTLVLTSTDIFNDQEAFFRRLIHYKCSVWTSTPSFAYLFLRHPDFNSENFPSIKTFLFMGEDLPNRTCKQLKNTFDNIRILNAYGPTEATIVTTLIEITNEVIEQYPILPIGYPMPESKLLIEKVNPEDLEGELIIVGEHVSIGYFKNEEMIEPKFFIHEGKRAFKTGDLAYYKNDLLFCIGRNDDQVKMHGFRIELNEISSVICKNELISDAVTVALKRNNEVKKIISFIITKKDIEKGELNTQLLPFLKNKIPYYMIPGDIVIVPEFPYNVSHKIDKNRLINEYLKNQFNKS